MRLSIPVSETIMGEIEEQFLIDCIRTGWVSSEGKYVKEFERKCAEYCSMEQGIAVSNGTSALQVAVQCLPIGEGDEIIMPTFTIISCVIAIIEAGATPVLVDCDPETWTMNVEDIEKKVTSKTKGIMAVHIYGHPVDMDPILHLANKNNLYVIEDVAEAHGAEYKERKCGGLSDVSVLSFYANKLITTGEGGMILTKDSEFAERAKSLRNLCFRSDRRFYHTEIGHNYRMSNIQAAVGVAQLTRLEGFISRKREMAEIYNEKLKDLPLQLPIEKDWAKNIYWMYAIVLDDTAKFEADNFIKLLMQKQVQSRPFFLGMHEQPALNKMGLFVGESYPVCEKISRKGLYLPSGQAITNRQIERVCKAVHEVFD